jgi:hypothetical protein
MKGIPSLAGLAGASALTILHEIVRRNDADAPRMDKMGMEATAKLLRKVNIEPPSEKKLYLFTLAGDIISNSLYYSKVASGSKKQVWMNGALMGLTAGLGAVYLPNKLGLNEGNSGRSNKTKLLTVGLYVVGGLVAAATASLLTSKKKTKMPNLRRYNGM